MAELAKDNQPRANTEVAPAQAKAAPAEMKSPSVDREALLKEMRLNNAQNELRDIEKSRKDLGIIGRLSGTGKALDAQEHIVKEQIEELNKKESSKQEKQKSLRELKELSAEAGELAEKAAEHIEITEGVTRGVRNGAIVLGATIATGGVAAGTFVVGGVVVGGGALTVGTLATAAAVGTGVGTTIGALSSTAEQSVRYGEGEVTLSEAAKNIGVQTLRDAKTSAMTSVGTAVGMGVGGAAAGALSGKAAQIAANGGVAMTEQGIAALSTAAGIGVGATASTVIGQTDAYITLRSRFNELAKDVTFESPKARDEALHEFLKESGFTAKNIAVDYGVTLVAAGVGAGGQIARASMNTIAKRVILEGTKITVEGGAALAGSVAKKDGKMTLEDFVDPTLQALGGIASKHGTTSTAVTSMVEALVSGEQGSATATIAHQVTRNAHAQHTHASTVHGGDLQAHRSAPIKAAAIEPTSTRSIGKTLAQGARVTEAVPKITVAEARPIEASTPAQPVAINQNEHIQSKTVASTAPSQSAPPNQPSTVATTTPSQNVAPSQPTSVNIAARTPSVDLNNLHTQKIGETLPITVGDQKGSIRVSGKAEIKVAYVGSEVPVDGKIAPKGNVQLLQEIYAEKKIAELVAKGTPPEQATQIANVDKAGVGGFYDRKTKTVFAPSIDKGADAEARAAFSGLLTHEIRHQRGGNEVQAFTAEIKKLDTLGYNVELTNERLVLKQRGEGVARSIPTENEVKQYVDNNYSNHDIQTDLQQRRSGTPTKT